MAIKDPLLPAGSKEHVEPYPTVHGADQPANPHKIPDLPPNVRWPAADWEADDKLTDKGAIGGSPEPQSK